MIHEINNKPIIKAGNLVKYDASGFIKRKWDRHVDFDSEQIDFWGLKSVSGLFNWFQIYMRKYVQQEEHPEDLQKTGERLQGKFYVYELNQNS